MKRNFILIRENRIILKEGTRLKSQKVGVKKGSEEKKKSEEQKYCNAKGKKERKEVKSGSRAATHTI